jgi:hypothetical protein
MAIVDQAVDLQPQQRVNSNSNSNNNKKLDKKDLNIFLGELNPQERSRDCFMAPKLFLIIAHRPSPIVHRPHTLLALTMVYSHALIHILQDGPTFQASHWDQLEPHLACCSEVERHTLHFLTTSKAGHRVETAKELFPTSSDKRQALLVLGDLEMQLNHCEAAQQAQVQHQDTNAGIRIAFAKEAQIAACRASISNSEQQILSNLADCNEWLLMSKHANYDTCDVVELLCASLAMMWRRMDFYQLVGTLNVWP